MTQDEKLFEELEVVRESLDSEAYKKVILKAELRIYALLERVETLIEERIELNEEYWRPK